MVFYAAVFTADTKCVSLDSSLEVKSDKCTSLTTILAFLYMLILHQASLD